MQKKRNLLQDKCKRCGMCCKVFLGGDLNEKINWEDCKHLVRYRKGRSYCIIYHHRIGAINGQSQSCAWRNDLVVDFPDCPFNTGKPIHPYYRPQH